jgi:hypothetical protein
MVYIGDIVRSVSWGYGDARLEYLLGPGGGFEYQPFQGKLSFFRIMNIDLFLSHVKRVE